MSAPDLTGKVALVAGATRGAGRAIAVELARAGATRLRDRTQQPGRRPVRDRPTRDHRGDGELIAAAGGNGVALRVDHLEPDQVLALVERIDADHGRLDILVNDIFGGDRYAQFGTTLWEHDLDGGLRMLRMGIDTHVITSHFALPLLIAGREDWSSR
ncbi:SDR family NAD(P)-dependent oxidoreductase [Rhodococcus hoagii]|nr:SDR family NAD(P)-dependent oxidoreductase [Prescottella equi]